MRNNRQRRAGRACKRVRSRSLSQAAASSRDGPGQPLIALIHGK